MHAGARKEKAVTSGYRVHAREAFQWACRFATLCYAMLWSDLLCYAMRYSDMMICDAMVCSAVLPVSPTTFRLGLHPPLAVLALAQRVTAVTVCLRSLEVMPRPCVCEDGPEG